MCYNAVKQIVACQIFTDELNAVLPAAAGWNEVDVRQNFGRFDQFLLLDTGVNLLSEDEILEFCDRTQVLIQTREISLDYFREKLVEVLH